MCDMQFLTIANIAEMFQKANEGSQISYDTSYNGYTLNCFTKDGNFSLPEGFTLEGDNLKSDKFSFLFSLKFNHKSKAMQENDEYINRYTRPDFNSFLANPKVPKEEKRKIIDIRNNIGYEERRIISHVAGIGLWVLVGAAGIYLNKEGIMPAIQNPQELLQSWPQFTEFLTQLGPVSLISLIEIIFHSRSCLKHIDKFTELIMTLNSYSEVNMTQIPNNTILENLRENIQEAFHELNETIGRRH